MLSRPAPPVVADAPVPQPSRPSFTTPGSASDEIRNAIRDAARSRGVEGVGDRGPVIHTSKGADAGGGVQILSDTQGVDFSEWSKHFRSDVMRNWIPLLPEETDQPLFKKGETYLIVTINKDGSIGDMKLENSSRDVAIDKAAWASITSEGKFEGLPRAFNGPSIVLRIHYMVNEDVR
jgi:outer membrane biosynthesis protein TonB